MYQFFRNQLGSIRKVYLKGNTIIRRDDFASYPETVLLLHGFFQTRNIWEVMEQRLRRENIGVFSFDLGGLLWRFNTRSITEQAQNIAEKIESICERRQLESFHIVGHSMGGLIARTYIQQFGGDRRVKSLVTLGTPHHGTPTAILGVGLMGGGLLSVSPLQMLPRSRLLKRMHETHFPAHIPLTSIFSRQDLVCPWWASVLAPHHGNGQIQNFQVNNVGHSELTSSSAVYQLVLQSLRHRINRVQKQ
ncbi:MAG: alpha/beta fold hydrolase [Myxococcota bacterium]|nr:alpha/beta fold hydrolase [Myxococcota bacterium]